LLTGIFTTYEADAAAAVAAETAMPLEPLVSPQRVQQLAHILGADLAREPFLVPAAQLLLSSYLAVLSGRIAEWQALMCSIAQRFSTSIEQSRPSAHITVETMTESSSMQAEGVV